MTDNPNLTRLRAFVRGHRYFASQKPPTEQQAYLDGWAAYVWNWHARLGDDAPEHLAGLTAFDLANARDALAAPLADKVAA